MSASSYFGFSDEDIADAVFEVASELVPEMRGDDTVQVAVRMGAGYYFATIYSERESSVAALEEAETRIDDELRKRRVPAVVSVRSKHTPSSASSQREFLTERGRITISVSFNRRFVQAENGVVRESRADATTRLFQDVRRLAGSASIGTRPVTAKGDFVWINLDEREYRQVAEQLPPHVVPPTQ